MKVTAINRSVAYTNTAIKSQPVVYQGKWEGKWNSTDGDSYNKKTTIYIRDLYGDGIDTNGSSFTEAEKAQFNWKGLRVQAYFSTFDAPKDSDGYNLIDANANFTPLENICVHSDDVEKLTSGTITDINGKEIPVSVDKPVWAISLTAGYKFDQNSNYFIYVHDQAGHWTKFLLDTKAPEMTAEGDISVSKSGDTYTCEISNMKFEDKVIEASTSALKNVEGFTYSANATKENSSIFDALRANTTGEDPFQYTSKNYWSTTKNADGTFTFSRPMNLKENQMLYIFAQDAYGNTTALQYVPVTFDATEGGAKIQGTRIMKLSEVIDNYCTGQFDFDMLLKSMPATFSAEKYSLVKNDLLDLKIELNEITECAKEGIEISDYMLLNLETQSRDEVRKTMADIKEKIDFIEKQFVYIIISDYVETRMKNSIFKINMLFIIPQFTTL